MIMLRRFVSGTRGAAAIAAALLSMMVLGGSSLIIDHVWLVHGRDALKNSADSAVVAVPEDSGAQRRAGA